MKPTKNKSSSKTRKTSVKAAKPSVSTLASTKYKTGALTKKKTVKGKTNEQPSIQNSGQPFTYKAGQEKRPSKSRKNVISEPPQDESDPTADYSDDQVMQAVFNEPQKVSKTLPPSKSVNKSKGKKKDARDYLINMITDVIQKKQEFRPEDLDPDALKMFKDNKKLVMEMKRLGIEPPRVNILEEVSDTDSENCQKFPGNNKVHEKFDRTDRYGVFKQDMWDRAVDLYYDDPSYKRPNANKQFHIEAYNERFEQVEDEMVNFRKLADLQTEKLKNQLKVEDYEEPYDEEHLKYEENLHVPKPHRKLLFSKEADPKAKDLPGTTNSQKRVEEVKKMQATRRKDAALTIQALYRGYRARQLFKKLHMQRVAQDAEDYGYFDVTGTSVKQFFENRRQKLEDERIRKQAIDDLTPSQAIESDRFLMEYLDKNDDGLSMVNIYFNKMNGKDPFASPDQSRVTMPETPSKSRSRSRRRTLDKQPLRDNMLSSNNDSIQESIKGERSASKFSTDRNRGHRTQADDDYSEDFETESIRESIRESISGSFREKHKKGPKALDSGKKSKTYDASRKKSPRPYQSSDDISESIHVGRESRTYKSGIRDSIEEEIIEESIVNRGSLEDSDKIRLEKRKGNKITESDSIKEEIEGSGKLTDRLKDSIPEEIDGSDAYSQNFESISGDKASVRLARGRASATRGMQPKVEKIYVFETKEDVELRRKIEKRYGIKRPDLAEDMAFNLLDAYKTYENSSVTMHCVDKFERMLAMQEAQTKLISERLINLQKQRDMESELDRVRNQQIGELLVTLLSGKSELDPKLIALLMSNGPLTPEQQEKLRKLMKEQEAKGQEAKVEKKSPRKREENVPESKGVSMFGKQRLQHRKLITPKNDVNDLGKKVDPKRNIQWRDHHDESADSVTYSENFIAESGEGSKSRNTIVKSKDEIEEDIPEDIDDIKETITEKIEEDYSVDDFEDIPESIDQSKTLPRKSKFKEHSNRLNSKYSASKIEEESDSIQEDIEESLPVRIKGLEDPHDHSSTSYRDMSRVKHKDPAIVSKPEIGLKHKHSKHFPQNRLLEKLQDNNVNDFIRTISKGIDATFKEEIDKLFQEYSDDKIDDREYAERKKKLEEWREKEVQDMKKKKMLIEGWVQMNEIVSKIKPEDESIGHSSGSIKDLRRVPTGLISKPPHYGKRKEEEKGSSGSDFDAEDHSDDSIGLRRAKKQIRDIRAHENQDDSVEEDILDEADLKMRKKSVKNKKKAADQLLEEKEKAIQEGLRQKMLELEEKHAQSLLDEALKIDVQKEIEKRFNMMRDFDEEQKMIRRQNERTRQRQLEDSIEDSSVMFRQSKVSDRDTIGESRKTIEQDKPSELSDASRNIAQIKKSKSKEDSVDEDIIEESIGNYSNDFNSISHSHSQIEIIKPIQPKVDPKKPQDEIKEESNVDDSDIPSEIDEDYSENFDESHGSSLATSIKDLNKNKDKLNKNSGKVISDQIKEAADEEEEEEPDSSAKKSQGPMPAPDSKSEDELVESNEYASSQESHDEFVKRIPTGKSDDYIQKLDSISSMDQEVFEGSHGSVDWVVDIPIPHPDDSDKLKTINEDSNDSDKKDNESKKNKEVDIDEDIDEEYSMDDFDDDFGSDVEESKDKQDTPRISETSVDIMKDNEKLADLIADELFNSIDEMGLFEKGSRRIIPQRDFTLDDYKSKFPFVRPRDASQDKKMEVKAQVEFFNSLADEVLKPINCREIIRKLLQPTKVDYLEELRKLRVGETEDDVDPGDEENLISEKLFKKVNSRTMQQHKDLPEEQQEAIKIHNKALYSAFNETFTKMIPTGLKDDPYRWISRDQAFKYDDMKSENSITERDIAKILRRVQKKLREFVSFPDSVKDKHHEKPPSQDEQPDNYAERAEEKRKKKIMDDLLVKVMKSELDECEKEWTGYEQKEMIQVVFDCSDRIMDELMQETAALKFKNN